MTLRSQNIPDHYKGDRHLTNWMRKHLCMESLELVYVHEDSERDHITKQSANFDNNFPILLQFPNKVVKIQGVLGLKYMENIYA